MYHHSFACSLDSISFPCGYDELNIVSAKYGTFSDLNNSFINDICNNNYLYNQTFIKSFGDNINLLQFTSTCDITHEFQSISSFNDQNITTLLSNNNCDINMSISQTYLLEMFYYCPTNTNQKHGNNNDIMDNYFLSFDMHGGASTNIATDLSHFITHKLINPSNSQSVYYLCLIIICILFLLLLCGGYYCCIHCIRCYQYNYFCCYFICCYSIVKYICCCEYCNEFNWLYYTKDAPNNINEKLELHSMNNDMKININNSKHMQIDSIPSPNNIGFDIERTESIHSKHNNTLKYKPNMTIKDEKLRISVHSLSPNISPYLHGQPKPCSNNSCLPSNNTTPIPNENHPSNHTENGNIAPIIAYKEGTHSTHTNTSHNYDTNTQQMGVIFRSPASIELSPISTASQIGIEMNNNLLSSPYKQSVYYSNHTNDIQTHSHIQHNMTESVTDVAFQQQSVNINGSSDDNQMSETNISDEKDKTSSPDLILPSDNSDVETDDQVIEHMLPGINNSKSNRSKSYKQYMSTHQKKKKLRVHKNNINDSGSETDTNSNLPPQSTRVKLNKSKSKTNGKYMKYGFEFDSIEPSGDMTNVVMVNYDSSPGVGDDINDMDSDSNNISNRIPVNELIKRGKSIDSTNYNIIPDFIPMKSNQSRVKNNKFNMKRHTVCGERIQETVSDENNSPLKLVKAATWNGRSSQIIELFDIENKAEIERDNSISINIISESEKENSENEKGNECEQIGLYENANSGHIFSASLEQYPLESELKTIIEISHVSDTKEEEEEEEEEIKEEIEKDKSEIWKEQLLEYGGQYININDLIFIQLIDTGTNSKIFKGKWKNSMVCIKMYNKNYSFKKLKTEIKMSMNEIKTHPHILTIYGYTFDFKHNSFGIITQLMSNGSAINAIRKQKFNIVPILLMLKYACCGLLHLHEMNIIHRNLNAKHILLDVSGKCVLSNFRESIKDTNASNINIDTFKIIATTPPEVMTCKTYNKLSDIYSFGIACWEILTGQIPFDGQYKSDIDAQIKINKSQIKLYQYNIPDDIFQLLSNCWDINPNNRPNAQYIIHELDNKLYKYRLLNKINSHSIKSLPNSIITPSSIYSAPVNNNQIITTKRPSLIPIKHKHVSAPFPIQQTTHISPQISPQLSPNMTAMHPPILQSYYTYTYAPIRQPKIFHNQTQYISKTNPNTPLSMSAISVHKTPPPSLALSPNNNNNNNNTKPPTLQLYSRSAISPTRKNEGPPPPIVLAKINSQSVID